jgi:hypothetical protein
MITNKYVLDSKKFYVVLNDTPVDITQYVLTTPAVELEWGFQGDSSVNDLLAPTGTARFTINNVSGLFTPDDPGALPGWKKGVRAYIEFTFEADKFRRFSGYIQDIVYNPAKYGSNVGVVVTDWFDIASRYPMDSVPISTNKRANEVVIDIMDRTFVPPAQYDLSTGINLFSLVYSSLTRKTRAYTELGKVAASEYCKIYLRKNKTDGEMLILENMLTRHGWSPLVQIKGDKKLILRAGSPTSYILKAGSTTDRLLTAGGVMDVDLNNIFLEGQLDIRHGANVINVVEFTAYPSRVDTSDQVLFMLQEPIQITTGQTVTVRGNYFNSASGISCNGMNMIAPSPNLDYKAWTGSGGTGTDFTMSLVITPVYNSDGFEHQVYNGSGYNGYITQFNIRGRGVYLENTITSRITDEASILVHGETSASLDQKYQRTTYLGEIIARSIVEQHKDATINLKSIKFNANSATELMRLFTVIDVGDLVHVKSTLGNIDGHYYINKVKLTIAPGDICTAECTVQEKLSIKSGALTEIAVDFRGEGFKDAIHFGHLSYMADLPYRTMCAWIKTASSPPDSLLDYLMGFFSDYSSFEFLVSNTSPGTLGFIQKYTPNGQQVWYGSTFPLNRGTWYHVAVFKTLSSNEPPVFYVNGAPIGATLNSTPDPDKTAYSDSGVPFILGNIKTSTIDYQWGFSGTLQDARVYNRELTNLEITTIYNGGVRDPSIVVDANALLFQAMAVRTRNLSSYVDQPLTNLDVMDNMFRAAGVVIGSPIGRSRS